jgi:hypothetical protein
MIFSKCPFEPEGGVGMRRASNTVDPSVEPVPVASVTRVLYHSRFGID